MKTRMISAMLAAFLLATASVSGITASAAEKATAAETTHATEGDIEESSAETSETTTTESDESSSAENSDDMEKFREVMSELAETGTTDVVPDYDGDPYYDTDGNATLIKSEQIIYNTEEMQFIAVTTKDGHVFYVLINYTAANGEDNVYFLNKVDDYDLYALLYAGEDDKDSKITPEQAHQAAEKANGRVTGEEADSDTAENAEVDESASEAEVQPKKAPVNMGSIYLVLGVVALIGIGAAGFMLTKKKGKGKTAPEFEQGGTDSEEDEDFDFYDENNNDDE